MLKNLLVVLVVFGFYFSNSQSPPKNTGQSVLGLVSSVRHDTCLNKQFSIIFYIVLDSNLTIGTSTPPRLQMIIDTLNKYFRPICVSFANCSTVHIPNYPYNRWKRSATDPVVTNNWYAEKTINFYLVDSVKYEAGDPETKGYAHPPRVLPTDTVKDVFVMEKFRLQPSNVGSNLKRMCHNMGHFFGLSHTYAELNPSPPQIPGPPSDVATMEFANGSNGDTHGDLITDTEADPGYALSVADGNGDRYIPPSDNFMTMEPGCRFTQQQYNWMARVILTKRLYLH